MMASERLLNKTKTTNKKSSEWLTIAGLYIFYAGNQRANINLKPTMISDSLCIRTYMPVYLLYDLQSSWLSKLLLVRTPFSFIPFLHLHFTFTISHSSHMTHYHDFQFSCCLSSTVSSSSDVFFFFTLCLMSLLSFLCTKNEETCDLFSPFCRFFLVPQ